MIGWIMWKKENITDKQDIISILYSFIKFVKSIYYNKFSWTNNGVMFSRKSYSPLSIFSHIKTFSDDTYWAVTEAG